MQAILWIGAVFAAAGLVGLAWCIREGLRLRSPARKPEQVRGRLRMLNAINFASVAVGFIGLGMVAVGVILG